MNDVQMSLLDLAVKRSGETPDTDISEKRTLIFVGSKSVGKSTMIQRFLEKNDAIKDTLALEYSFGRKSGRSLNKEICHVWELGGGNLFASLLPNVLGTNEKESSMLLVLDLSSPQTLWITMETLLQTAHNTLNKSSELRTSALARIPSDHPDTAVLSPFLMPLIIIGGKYDVFVTMDPEDRKLITRTLRLVAHTMAASLFYYSDLDSSLVRKLKDMLNHFGFGGAQLLKGYCTDANSPVFVPFGSDSFESIGANINQIGQNDGLGLEMYKHAFTTRFQQRTEYNVIPDDPGRDINFKEPVIDQLRAYKDEELDQFLQELEKRRKLLKIK